MKNELYIKVTKFIYFYADKRISHSAAALAYYITLTLFPFLICLNALLADTGFTIMSVLEQMQGIIPSETAHALASYIRYIMDNDSPFLLTSGILLMITMSSAAFRVLMSAISDTVGHVRYKGLIGYAASFVLAFGFVVAIYVSVIVMVAGQWLFAHLPQMPNVAMFFLSWRWSRFLIMFLFLYFAVLALFTASINYKKGQGVIIGNGALLTSLILVGVSAIFSLAIELTTRYTLVYGSLASVIVLMVWLFFCGNILILGGIVCGGYIHRDTDKRDQKTEQNSEYSE